MAKTGAEMSHDATHCEGGPSEVPFVEQLRSIPKDYRTVRAIQWSEDGRETGHQYIPVGVMMHRAADEIEKLSAQSEIAPTNWPCEGKGPCVKLGYCPYVGKCPGSEIAPKTAFLVNGDGAITGVSLIHQEPPGATPPSATRENPYEQAIRGATGSILSAYAAGLILERAEKIAKGEA